MEIQLHPQVSGRCSSNMRARQRESPMSTSSRVSKTPSAAGAVPARSPELYRPGYELAAERIVEFIAGQQLRPGDRLPPEAELAQTLGFGRSVVREAVKVLSALGRVHVRKGAGLYVADDTSLLATRASNQFMPADLDHLAMLFEYRLLVDPEAARLAATRAAPLQLRAMAEAVNRCQHAVQTGDRDLFDAADDEFHRAVAVAARNMFLETAHATIRQLQEQAAVLGLRGQIGGSAAEAADAHRDILAAIQAGDPD